MKFSELPIDDLSFAYKSLPKLDLSDVDLMAEHRDYYDGPVCGFATINSERCWFHWWGDDDLVFVALTPGLEAIARAVVEMKPWTLKDLTANVGGIGTAEVIGWGER